MRLRHAVWLILAAAWLFAAGAVGVATASLVAESGWSELPLPAWLLIVGLGVAFPALVYGGYRYVLSPDEA